MLVPGSVLDLDWMSSSEGRQILICLQHRSGLKLRQFGLLENPYLPSHLSVDEECYKIFLVGKSGVGKTSTVARLTGAEVPQSHNETPGLQISHLYWPGRIKSSNRTVLFKLLLFDAGETALRRYDHILPACQEKLDAIIFLFSFVDKGSFSEVPDLMTRYLNDGITKIILGTKLDLIAHSEVTQRDICSLETDWKIPVLRICNIPNAEQAENPVSGLGDIIPLLNTLCEHLSHRNNKKKDK